MPNNNPLATTIGPPSAGTKLSLTIIAPRSLPPQSLFNLNSLGRVRSNVPRSISEEVPQSPVSDNGSAFKSNGTVASLTSFAPAFGDGNPALAIVINAKDAKDPSKKRKPKNNIVKSNSSFVSRVIPHEGLQKRLNERGSDGIIAFANINRAVQWLDLSSETKVGAAFAARRDHADSMQTENLTKVLFTKANALCHDVNQFTKSTTHLDVILGFNTSDIIWYEPMTQKYARLNKNVSMICRQQTFI